jgi:hypothetical protein
MYRLTAILATASLAASLPRSIAPDFFGVNVGAGGLEAAPFQDPTFISNAKALHYSTLRFPAGTLGNYFNWSTGCCTGPYKNTCGNTLEAFAVSQRALNVSVVWMLNLLTDTLASQLAMLRHASALGMPVTYVELGNEFYLDETDFVEAFPSGAAYGAVAAQWIAALREAFPGVAVGVVSCPAPAGSGGGGSPRGQAWDEQVFAALQSGPGALRPRDGVTIHVYTPPGATANRSAFTPADVPQVLAAPFALASAVAQAAARKTAALPPGVNVWFTEYNLQFWGAGGGAPPQGPPLWGTWADALILATTSLQLLAAVPSAALLTHHELIGAANSGDLFASSTAFDFPGSPDAALPTVRLAPSGAGAALGLLGVATRGRERAAAVPLPSAPPLLLPPPAAVAVVPAPSAFGAVFFSAGAGGGGGGGSGGGAHAPPAGGLGAVALNLGGQAFALEVWRLGAAAGLGRNVTWGAFTQLSGDPRAPVNAQAVLRRTTGSPAGGLITLPPYSITQLS